jgi:hypothetical protein
LEIYSAFFILKNFFDGVNEVTGDDLKPVFEFFINSAPRLYQIAIKDVQCESKEL